MHAIRPARLAIIASLLIGPALVAQVPTASDPPKYVLPPKPIVDVFDAEFLPDTTVSPNRQVVALTKARAYPTITELSQPMYRLAGSRVNPKTNGPHRASGLAGTAIYAITLKKIADGSEVNVTVPPQAKISNVRFSSDGSKLAFLNTKETAIELWIADAATGAAKAVVSGGDRINATAGDPCDWVRDNVTMLCAQSWLRYSPLKLPLVSCHSSPLVIVSRSSKVIACLRSSRFQSTQLISLSWQ